MAIGASKLKSLVLPVTPAGGAVRIAQSATVPLRVEVVVSGPAGSLAFLAFDAGALNPVSGGFTAAGVTLPAGGSQIFIVAPGQVLFIVGNVTGMSCAIAESDAIPLDEDSQGDGGATVAPGPIQVQAQGPGVLGISFDNENWIHVAAGMGLVQIERPGQRLFVKALSEQPVRISLIAASPRGESFQLSGTVGPQAITIPLWGPARAAARASAASAASAASGASPTRMGK